MSETIIKNIEDLLDKNDPKNNVKELEKIEKYIKEQKDKEREKIKETDDDIRKRFEDFYKKEKISKEQIKELNKFIVKKDYKNSKEQSADYYREDYYIYDIYYKKKKIVLTFQFIGPYDGDGLTVYIYLDNEKEEMDGLIIKEVINYLKLKKIDTRILFKYFSCICENENFSYILCKSIEDYFNDSDESKE